MPAARASRTAPRGRRRAADRGARRGRRARGRARARHRRPRVSAERRRSATARTAEALRRPRSATCSSSATSRPAAARSCEHDLGRALHVCPPPVGLVVDDASSACAPGRTAARGTSRRSASRVVACESPRSSAARSKRAVDRIADVPRRLAVVDQHARSRRVPQRRAAPSRRRAARGSDRGERGGGSRSACRSCPRRSRSRCRASRSPSSRRTIAPRSAIARAPSASAIVTVAASPSGTAATATETPTRNASSAVDPRASMAPPSTSVTTMPSPTISRASRRDAALERRRRRASPVPSSPAIRPSSASARSR